MNTVQTDVSIEQRKQELKDELHKINLANRLEKQKIKSKQYYDTPNGKAKIRLAYYKKIYTDNPEVQTILALDITEKDKLEMILSYRVKQKMSF